MNTMNFSATTVTFLAFLIYCTTLVSAHARWKCPEPRSDDTGIKSGPCGSNTNDFSVDDDDILELTPGPLRVTFEESVFHTGAPFRISLSGDGSDDDDTCILLDHIPHNDDPASWPFLFDPSTYTPYHITIDIPNVSCERCSLHLSNPMTDKIGKAGRPTGIGCTDPNGSCFSVYHSCTKPFRMAGSVPRSEYKCPLQDSIIDWPKQWIGDSGEIVDASTPGVYRRESALWSKETFTLEDVPSRYVQDAGGVCGAKMTNVKEEIGSISGIADTDVSESDGELVKVADETESVVEAIQQNDIVGDLPNDTSAFEIDDASISSLEVEEKQGGRMMVDASSAPATALTMIPFMACLLLKCIIINA